MIKRTAVVAALVTALIALVPLAHAAPSTNRGTVRGAYTVRSACCTSSEVWEGPLTLDGTWPGGGTRFVGTIHLGQAYGSYDFSVYPETWAWKVHASVSGDSSDGRHLSGYCVYAEPPVTAGDCFTTLDGGPVVHHVLRLATLDVVTGSDMPSPKATVTRYKVVGTYSVE